MIPLPAQVQPVEVGQGMVRPVNGSWQLSVPPAIEGYHNAQLDDYRGRRRKDYLHRPGTRLTLSARFSHEQDELVGTAGFGFWNAALGDRELPIPALPQAVWFFFAAPPNELPFGPLESGRGWFANTLDAGTGRALAWLPFAPLVLLLNQWPAGRRRIWPMVRRALNIRAEDVPFQMTDWHDYRLEWREDGCLFWVDGRLVLHTPFSPRGPLGFVCWIDNQYMVVPPTGRVGWGTTPVVREQWLEIREVGISLVMTGDGGPETGEY